MVLQIDSCYVDKGFEKLEDGILLFITDVSTATTNDCLILKRVLESVKEKDKVLRLILDGAEHAVIESTRPQKLFSNIAEFISKSHIDLRMVTITNSVYGEVKDAVAEKWFGKSKHILYVF